MSAPGIAVSPAALKFGDVPVGQPSAAQTVTVSNIGNTDLVIGAVALTGPNSSLTRIYRIRRIRQRRQLSPNQEH
jgi:hypothetical protein